MTMSTRPRPLASDDSPAGESLPRLVWLLVYAAAARTVARCPRRIVDWITTTCAMAALVAPLGLWVSWSAAVFLTVLGVSLACIAVVLLLVLLYPDGPD